MNASQTLSLSTIVLILGGFSSLSIHATEPQQIPTVVTVKKLCPTCGKKIVQKLSELPQVAKATMNIEQRTLRVQCKPGGSVSPRDVWETVERGGEQPVKIECPMGTFTTKPKQ